METSLTSSPLLTRGEAARYLKIESQTLAAWACHGRYDLPVVKVGRAARYRLADLEAFIDRRRVAHTGVTPQ